MYVKKILTILYSVFISQKFRECGRGFRIHFPSILNCPSRIKIGADVTIGTHCWLNCTHASQEEIALEVGDGCHIGRFVHINAWEKVVLEPNVLLADRVHISDMSHVYSDPVVPVMNQGTEFRKPVIVKSGAWIGIGAVILPGVTIGRNAVIGANAVLTRDVPDYHSAMGVPASIFRPLSPGEHSSP